jgi:hypothetical protein
MKKEERIASSFLKTCFDLEPAYEPLGPSKPPDFRIRNIAFEIRRLNENFVHEDGTVEGLEELDYRLDRAMKSELEKVPFSTCLGSFALMLRYSRKRKIEPAKVANGLAKKALAHYSSGLRTHHKIDAHGAEAELIPLRRAYGQAFVRPFEFDEEGGGLVGEIYRANIEIALREKIHKTRVIVDRFEYWFLVLVDFITPESSWLQELGHFSPDLQHFNGIVVINVDGALLMEYPNNSLMQLAWTPRMRSGK